MQILDQLKLQDEDLKKEKQMSNGSLTFIGCFSPTKGMKPAFARVCTRHFTLTFYLILTQVMWSRWYNFITGKLAQGSEIIILLSHS